jgi:hypothetical protein
MKARAGHYGGERDDRGARRARWEQDGTRRHTRQVVRRELRDVRREATVRGISAVVNF